MNIDTEKVKPIDDLTPEERRSRTREEVRRLRQAERDAAKGGRS